MARIDTGEETKVTIPIYIPDSEQTGLAADSTGVKWTSELNKVFNLDNLESVTLRASWTASAADSVTAIEVFDQDAASVLGSVSGNTGADVEGVITGFVEGNSVVVRANVTTASATGGATTDVNWAALELIYNLATI